MKVSASTTKVVDGKKVKDKTYNFNVDIPATLKAKVTKFGEDVVDASAEDSLVIAAQALARRLMVPTLSKDGKVTRAAKTEVEIQAVLNTWNPDVKSVVRQTAFEKASSALDRLTPEDRKKLLATLQAQK